MNRRNLLFAAFGVIHGAVGGFAYQKGREAKERRIQSRIDRGEPLIGEHIETDKWIVIRDNTVIQGCSVKCKGVYIPSSARNWQITNNEIELRN